MGYVLGTRSRAELAGVHPQLVQCVQRAIQITTQDFTVHDGIRTLDEQRALLAKGASQTLKSKHLKQADGYGHAVDLVPWIAGKARWEWPAIYPIAAAMWQASAEYGVRIRWGGPWQALDLIKGGKAADMERAVKLYGERQRLAGKKAFTDGPHFELLL